KPGGIGKLAVGYDVPVCGVSWRFREYAGVLRGLLAAGSKFENDRVKLQRVLEETFSGRATLFNSGRSALEAALRSISAKHGGDPSASVLVPSLVCRAVPDKVVLSGMKPIFYDVRPDMTPCEKSLRESCTPNTVAVVFPYLYGKVGGIQGAADF